MEDIPEPIKLLLQTILGYLINLASSERYSAIEISRENKLKEAVEDEASLIEAIASSRSIRNEVKDTCIKMAKNRVKLGVSQAEEPVWHLLTDEVFQNDLINWLMAGGIDEGKAARENLLELINNAVLKMGASSEHLDFLKSEYFDTLEKAIFSNPILSRWRHQLSMEYLREQVTQLQHLAEEAAGQYSFQKQHEAIDSYCSKALKAWDIIDLSNLPEGDVHIAAQKFLLRQLYLPLRISFEKVKSEEGGDNFLESIKKHNEVTSPQLEEFDEVETVKNRVAIGKQLAITSRIVILGEPGGGKTTMLRWIATAYLLKRKDAAAFNQLPDFETLPDQALIPVLIRCRDLGEADLCRSFSDFLRQHLNKTELQPQEAAVMEAVILDRIAKGEVILLVDGLDEISNPQVRMMFCQELERTAIRYPNSVVVVTSRIVGYRDMPYRMTSGFAHGHITELTRNDKDLFAHRWIDATEQHLSDREKGVRVNDLLEALHSDDRIEQLTGNPMLLTTLALVKRKVGKLPNKRTKLYSEAVSVLLNWNPRQYQIIGEDEAIPQLEYLAYEMCHRGIQRMSDDDVQELLENIRIEYPNIRAIRRREPKAFLDLLEARSSILVRSDGIWLDSAKYEKPAWEFRHLTFQEYLASKAILDGRYPGRDKTKSIIDKVRQLAEGLYIQDHVDLEDDKSISRSWRETIRLLVAECKDDDVDSVLLAILDPLTSRLADRAGQSRAILAVSCLADEPNVSEEAAKEILNRFALALANMYKPRTRKYFLLANKIALEVAQSLWKPVLKQCLIEEYRKQPAASRGNPGSVWGAIEAASWPSEEIEIRKSCDELRCRLVSTDDEECISAALAIMSIAYNEKPMFLEGIVPSLFDLLSRGGVYANASAWAIAWLGGGFPTSRRPSFWKPPPYETGCLVDALKASPEHEVNTRRFLIAALGQVDAKIAIEVLAPFINEKEQPVRLIVAETLAEIDDIQSTLLLTKALRDPDDAVRATASNSLSKRKQTRPLKK